MRRHISQIHGAANGIALFKDNRLVPAFGKDAGSLHAGRSGTDDGNGTSVSIFDQLVVSAIRFTAE